MPLPRRIPPERVTTVYWHADSWLPCNYQEPFFISRAIRYALSKQGLRCPQIMACVNPSVFSDDLLQKYVYGRVFPLMSQEDEHERLEIMLADLVAVARSRLFPCSLVVVAKLSQHTEMISRVLGSLRDRGFHVVLVLPAVDVDEANNFGIYRDSNGSLEPGRKLPVWVCPGLFDEALPFAMTMQDRFEQDRREQEGEQEQEQLQDEDDKFFIKLPAPEITTFSMPTNVDTCVFWDVKDYPVPLGLDPRIFFENIKSAVHSSGDVSIYAYGVAEELESLPPDYLDAGITLVKVPADKVSRVTVMMVDFVLWSMDNRLKPPSVSNILVISKDELNSRSMFVAVLQGLIFRGYNVFLALPDDFPPPLYLAKSALLWKMLSAREKRKTREEDTVSASDDQLLVTTTPLV